MKVVYLIMVLSISLFAGASVSAVRATYEEVLAGKECQVSEEDQTISCKYRVGKDLEFSIDGIGSPMVGVTFLKSNFHGDYYAAFGLLHGCVIVKRGRKIHEKILEEFARGEMGKVEAVNGIYAFVSPKNGKVYEDWPSCQAGL